MNRMISSILVGFLLGAGLSIAQAEEPTYSRALQQAKRVTALRASAPSRVYWMSTRVIKNSKKKISINKLPTQKKPISR